MASNLLFYFSFSLFFLSLYFFLHTSKVICVSIRKKLLFSFQFRKASKSSQMTRAKSVRLQESKELKERENIDFHESVLMSLQFEIIQK